MRAIRIALACVLAGCTAEQDPLYIVLPPPPANVPDAACVQHVPCDAGLDCVAVQITPRGMGDCGVPMDAGKDGAM